MFLTKHNGSNIVVLEKFFNYWPMCVFSFLMQLLANVKEKNDFVDNV